MDKNRKVRGELYIHDPHSDIEKLSEQAVKYPGCRLFGKFDKIFKAKGELHFNFLDDYGVYKRLLYLKKLNINLGYKINNLIFGDARAAHKIVNDLKPF